MQRPSPAASPRSPVSTSNCTLRSKWGASGRPFREVQAGLKCSSRAGRGCSTASRWRPPLAAVQQEQLPPGESRQPGGGILGRFFSLITGARGICANAALQLAAPHFSVCKCANADVVLVSVVAVACAMEHLRDGLVRCRVPIPDRAKLCAADDTL